jgi:hypothetical protein
VFFLCNVSILNTFKMTFIVQKEKKMMSKLTHPIFPTYFFNTPLLFVNTLVLLFFIFYYCWHCPSVFLLFTKYRSFLNQNAPLIQIFTKDVQNFKTMSIFKDMSTFGMSFQDLGPTIIIMI